MTKNRQIMVFAASHEGHEMNPVTGPFHAAGVKPDGSTWRRTWYKQGKPYDLPLPYLYMAGADRAIVPEPYTGFGVESYISQAPAFPEYEKELARNRCREKLYDKLGATMDASVAIAERRRSLSMIATRASQLFRAFRAVKRLRFGEAAEILGVSKTPRGVSRAKQASGNWLEYHFGWSPLISDIYAATDVLQGPVPIRRVRASARKVIDTVSGSYPLVYGNSPVKVERREYEVRSGFEFEITNPDLWLANRLGLVNPANVAWELVPFSFVVDWFVPIGSFLSSMTATLGLKVHNGWTSERMFFEGTSSSLGAVSSTAWPGYELKEFNYRGFGLRNSRQLGALSATPTLTFSPGFSPTRALTSLTLLIQVFGR